MKANVGGVDRLLRIGVGVALLGLTAFGTIGLWGLIGVLPLATGLIRVCPAYSVLGMSTCDSKAQTK
jgi:hypothetical protein